MSTPSKSAVLGAGSSLSIGGPTGGTVTTFVHIGELSDFKFDGWSMGTTDTTNYDSGQVVQKLGTLLDYGTLSGTYNNVFNDAGQLALLTAFKTGLSYDFKLQLQPNPLAGQTTTGNLYLISGIITKAGGFDLSQTKVSSCPFELSVNAVAVTPGT